MSEISIKTVCCTCLANDRKLFQLSKILDGINMLYTLLTHDPEAYKHGFYKDTAHLFVCWECNATIRRIKKFQIQACVVQKHLTCIADGRKDMKMKSYSHLANHIAIQLEYHSNLSAENFIDCGPAKEIKTESDLDDIPLSELCGSDNEGDIYSDEIPLGKKYVDDKNTSENSNNIARSNKGLKYDFNKIEILQNDVKHTSNIPDIHEKYVKNCYKISELGKNDSKYDINYTNGISIQNDIFNKETADFLNSSLVSKINNKSVILNSTNKINNTDYEKDMKQKSISKITAKKKNKMRYSKYFSKSTVSEEEMINSRKKRWNDIKNSVFKCDTCLLEFKSENILNNHVTELHEMKGNCTQCDICHTYKEDINAHKQAHYELYSCVLCTHIAYTHMDIVRHLKKNHREMCNEKKQNSRLKKNGGRSKDSLYPCVECDLSFQNKDMRWKHVQKTHREGYKCKTCEKKFAFKNNLERHERIHQSPFPRIECTICHKMIRSDLVNTHARIHSHRQSFTCVECDKTFVCRTTYESHLKYAQAHATVDLYRHKCPSCDKGYRSRGELRDHVNYQHKGQAEHKCPVCGKGLATKRCIRRHVRRAHEGIKECAKDKICQQCGKAFRDKKGLIEHERVHSGARPLACGACGRAFRQRAALYAHTRRLHRPAPNDT